MFTTVQPVAPGSPPTARRPDVDAQLLDVFEEFVEARPPEDADHGAVSTAA
jgi:hypothetical protein